MAKKAYDHYKPVGKPAEKFTKKKKRPKLMAIVDEDKGADCDEDADHCTRPVLAREHYDHKMTIVQNLQLVSGLSAQIAKDYTAFQNLRRGHRRRRNCPHS